MLNVSTRYYALAAVAALMIHLENNMNIMFAPGTLRTYYRGTDQTAIVGITNKLFTLAHNI